MLEKNLRSLVAIPVALLTVACESSSVAIETPFHAAPYDALTLEVFSKNWAEATSQTSDYYEGEVAKDLRTKAPGNFNWIKLWQDFGTGYLKSPRSVAAEDVLLSREIPKCSPEIIDSFTTFALTQHSGSRLARRSICFLLNDACTTIPSTPLWKDLGALLISNDLTSKTFEECGGGSEQLINQYLSRAEKYAATLLPELELESYFKTKMLNLSKISATTRLNLELAERWERRSAPKASTLSQRLFSKILQVEEESFATFEKYWGLPRLIDLLSDPFYFEKFKSLPKDQKFQTFKALGSINSRTGNVKEWVQAFVILSKWAHDLVARDEQTLASTLDVLDKTIAQLATRDELRQTSNIDDLASILEATDISNPIRRWVLAHFQSAMITSAGLTKNPESLASALDQVFFYRLIARSAAVNPQSWKEASQSICKFYSSKSWTGSGTTWQERRGCVRTKSALHIESKADLSLSPDLIVFTSGKDLSIDVQGRLTYGFFDLSPDTLNSAPQVPEPTVGPTTFDALVFNVILGFPVDKQLLFVPFHFVAREGREVTEPNYEKTPPQAASGGYAKISVSGDLIMPAIVSHGGDGKPGTPPRLGGKGDCSESIDSDREQWINDRLEPYSFASGRKHRFSRRLSGQEWTLVLRSIAEARKNQTSNAIQVQEEMQSVLSEKDQTKLQLYLNSIAEPTPDELRAFQKRISADPDYETLLNSLRLVPLAETLEIYRWKVLMAQVVDQVVRIGSEQDFSISFLKALESHTPHPFSQETTFCVAQKGMSRPGKAPSSGQGGEVQIKANHIMNPVTAAQPGIRFLWPEAWNAGAYHGDIGAEGSVTMSEEP